MISAAALQANVGWWVPLIVGVLTLVGTLSTVVVTATYQLRNAEKQTESNERAKMMELESNERLKRWELLNERAKDSLDRKFTAYLATLQHATRYIENLRPVFNAATRMFDEAWAGTSEWTGLGEDAEKLKARDEAGIISPPSLVEELLPQLRTFDEYYVAERKAPVIGGVDSPEDVKVQVQLLAPQKVLNAVDAFDVALDKCLARYESYRSQDEILSKDLRLCRAAFYGVRDENEGFPSVEMAHKALRSQIQEDLMPTFES